MSALITALIVIGKILGIVLLVLLAIVALVLFVPVRYKAAGTVKNVPDPEDEEGKLSGGSLLRGTQGTFDATWLLHLLHFKAFFAGTATEETQKTKEEPSETKEVPETNDDPPEVKTNTSEMKDEPAETPSEESEAGTVSGFELRVAGFRINLPGKGEEEEEPEEEEKEKKSLRERLPELIAELPEKMKRFSEDGEGLRRIASDDATAASLKKAMGAVGKLLKRLRPKRWSAAGVIGLNDPADTGNLFAVIGAAYPFVSEHLDVAAQFERPAADLTAQAEGSVRVIGVIAAAAAFWFDKNVRKTRRQWKLWRNRRTRRTTSSRQSSAR